MRSMILIDCFHCGHRHLVSNGDVRSLTTVDETVLGEIHCAVSGKVVIHDFTNNRTIDPAEQLAARTKIEANAA